MDTTTKSTVSNTASSSEPLLKRKRIEQSGNSDSGVGSSGATSSSPIRDEKYYMDSEGADCVVLADNVLFKVHRFILSKDGSAFANMFALPGGIGDDSHLLPREGSSDDNPIVLQDGADQFRALLWCLYALPRDLQQHQGPSADLYLLIRLAMITHKYHFITTEAWALHAIYKIMVGPPAMWETSPVLSLVLGVAVLCEDEPLHKRVISAWIPRLLSGKLQPIPAIVAADKYGLPLLQGVAYYAQVLEMDKTNDIFTPPPNHLLSREQLISLLSGHWALVKRWEHIRKRPVPFQRSNGCTMHAYGCITTWNSRWDLYGMSEKLLAYPSVDVLGRLQCLYELLVTDELVSQQLTSGCRSSALGELGNFLIVQKSNLVEFFVDRTRAAPGSPVPS